MAAPTLVAVMQGIETRLKTIPDLNVDFFLPDSVTVPHAVVGVPAIPEYHSSFARGYLRIEPTITVFVSTADDQAGQMKLASYADPASPTAVIKAIEADKTLGAVVDDCIVVDFRPDIRAVGLQELGQINYYVGIFTLRVMAQGA